MSENQRLRETRRNSDDDTRAAANITVSLSTQLIAAALAMLAAEGAFIAFVLGNRQVHWHFYLLALLTFLAFAGSIYFGGSGLHATRVAVFDGSWELATGIKSFVGQTLSAIAGILLFVVLFVSGLSAPAKDDVADKLTTLNERIETLDGRIKTLSTEIKQLREQMESSAPESRVMLKEHKLPSTQGTQGTIHSENSQSPD